MSWQEACHVSLLSVSCWPLRRPVMLRLTHHRPMRHEAAKVDTGEFENQEAERNDAGGEWVMAMGRFSVFLHDLVVSESIIM